MGEVTAKSLLRKVEVLNRVPLTDEEKAKLNEMSNREKQTWLDNRQKNLLQSQK